MASHHIIVLASNWIVNSTHVLVTIQFEAKDMIIQFEAKTMISQRFKICSWVMRV